MRSGEDGSVEVSHKPRKKRYRRKQRGGPKAQSSSEVVGGKRQKRRERKSKSKSVSGQTGGRYVRAASDRRIPTESSPPMEPHLGEDVREPQLVTHLPMDGWNVDNTQTDDPDQTESDFRVRLQGRTDDLVSGYVTTRPLKQYDPSEGDEWSRPLGAAAAQTDGERITTLSETQPTTMEGGIP